MLRQQKVVFFLHLLGLDTAGHGYKPLSPEYLRNIRVVDDGIAEVYQLVERFFNNDGRTAYVFTSDHGMTDWGSHGAGEAHETMTPLIAWGAGIPTPIAKMDFGSDFIDMSSSSTSAGRKDVNQADVAPLMSALLGLNVPMNSVGRLPLSYLNASQRYRATAVCSTFRQLVEQMEVQRRRKLDSSFRLFFKDFPTLTPDKLKLIMGEMEKLLYVQKRFPAAERLCQDWSPVAVDGLIYYHQYERRFLSLGVALTFVFLELCVWRFASEAASEETDTAVVSGTAPLFLSIGAVVTAITFWTLSFPLARYLYGLVPLLLAAIAQPLWKNWIRFPIATSTLRAPSVVAVEFKRWMWSMWSSDGLASIFVVAVAIEIIVWAFFYRWILSIGLWILAFWPMANPLIGWALRTAWAGACLVVSVFPFLPTVGKSANPELIFYTCVIVGIALAFAFILYRHRQWLRTRADGEEREVFEFDTDMAIFGILFLYVMASGCINLTTSVSIEQRRGSPALNRFLSWLILFTSPFLTLFVRQHLWIRLCILAVAFFCPLTLMSVSYEPIFYVCLCALLYVWLRIEGTIEHGNDPTPKAYLNHLLVSKRPLSVDDVRRAYFFVFFVFLSFFGTGNIASINSFNPSFTAPFVTVFSPFVMGALLLTKIAIPFFVVCSVLCGLEAMTARSVGVLFWLIVMISDGMALVSALVLRHGLVGSGSSFSEVLLPSTGSRKLVGHWNKYQPFRDFLSDYFDRYVVVSCGQSCFDQVCVF